MLQRPLDHSLCWGCRSCGSAWRRSGSVSARVATSLSCLPGLQLALMICLRDGRTLWARLRRSAHGPACGVAVEWSVVRGGEQPPRRQRARWNQSGPQQSWFVDFVFGPKTHGVVAGGCDLIGIYRSQKGEPPWEMVLGDFCAWTLAMSPHDSKTIFGGDPCGRGVMCSTGGGATWERAEV